MLSLRAVGRAIVHVVRPSSPPEDAAALKARKRVEDARETERLIAAIRADEEERQAREQREEARRVVERAIARDGVYWPSDRASWRRPYGENW